MKNVIKKSMTSLFAVAVIGGTIGCDGGTRTKKTEQDPEKVEININPNQDSDTLTSSAEQLMSPYTFMLADSVLDMALTKDPNNIKAQFYKVFLKRLMLSRGMAKRIRPWIAEYSSPEYLKKYDEEVANFPESPLKEFLLDGSEDIRSPIDVQNWLVQYRNAAIDFHKFLKLNQDKDFKVYLNPHIFEQEIKKEMAQSCQVVGYQVVCNYKEVALRKVNAADMVALSQIAAGEVLYWTMYTSYSVKGLEALIKATDSKDALNARQVQAILESQPEFGLLRKDNTLKYIPSLGADFAAATRWAMQYQNQLCPKVAKGTKPRKGYVFDNGICVPTDSEAERAVTMFEKALNGAITVAVGTGNGEERETLVDSMAPVRNPVQDLRSVAPARYTKCSNGAVVVAELRDRTLGGLLPNGDANEFLQTCNNKSSVVIGSPITSAVRDLQ